MRTTRLVVNGELLRKRKNMGIIRSYGLFWDAEDGYWGKGMQVGSILGVPARARSSKPVDFRYQNGVYVLHKAHSIIYVGQAGARNAKLFSRLKKHRKDFLANRWDRFSWFGLRRVLSSGKLSTQTLRAKASIGIALNHIEAVLIAAAEPSLNKQGGRFGREATRYLQVRDERLGLTQEQMVRALWKNSLET